MGITITCFYENNLRTKVVIGCFCPTLVRMGYHTNVVLNWLGSPTSIAGFWGEVGTTLVMTYEMSMFHID